MDFQQPGPIESTTCEYCKKPVEDAATYCANCGFPVLGTQEEKNNFYYAIDTKQLDLQSTNAEVKKATNSLYVVAAVFGIYGIVYYFMNQDADAAFELVITNLILAVVFLLLAFWSAKKAIAAIISGLCLYTAIQLLNFIVDPATLVKGVVLKVIIYIYLIRGLQSAFQAQKINKSLKVK